MSLFYFYIIICKNSSIPQNKIFSKHTILIRFYSCNERLFRPIYYHLKNTEEIFLYESIAKSQWLFITYNKW